MLTETKPKLYTYENDFKKYCEARDQSEVCLCDNELSMYWLEVLPPIYMNEIQKVSIDGVVFDRKCSFGFAEGRETIVDFWPAGNGNYWSKRSNRLNRN